MSVVARLLAVVRNFVVLITATSTTFVEASSAWTALMASLWLWWWGDLSANVPFQRELLHYATETRWVIAFGLGGLAQTVANLFRRSAARMVMAWIAGVSWGWLAVVAYGSDSVVFPFAFVLCFTQGLSCLIMVRARFFEARRRVTSGESAAIGRR